MSITNEAEQLPLPTVSEVLQLTEMQLGEPRLLAGENGLQREVRWAHVVAGADAVRLLEGGELVLATGAGWPRDTVALAAMANGIVNAGGNGAAAVVIELGAAAGFAAVPNELVTACEAHSIPLFELHHEVRFVQITQRVHQRVLAQQTEALQARDAVHTMLTELGLNRSPVDYVVEQLASTLSAAVVLEDGSHRVVAWSQQGSAQSPSSMHPLTRWQAGRAPELPPDAERVPVEAQGRRWGYLTALPGPPHPAGRRTVLELGAFALALGRLADNEGDQWLQISSKRVFESLLQGRYRNDTELAAQLSAAGLPLQDRIVFAVTLTGSGNFGAHTSLEHATIETALRRAIAPEGRVLLAADEHANSAVLLALVSLPLDDLRGGVELDQHTPTLAVRLSRELEMLVPGTASASWRAHLAIGPQSKRLRQLVASLEQLRATGKLASAHEVGLVTVQQAEQRPLAHLMRSLSGFADVQQFASDMLGPLIEHDQHTGPGHSGDLLQVLAAYTSHPTNRSQAAQQAMLSRSVFYQRIELIEHLLGMDLADGETIAALKVALLVHRG